MAENGEEGEEEGEEGEGGKLPCVDHVPLNEGAVVKLLVFRLLDYILCKDHQYNVRVLPLSINLRESWLSILDYCCLCHHVTC